MLSSKTITLLDPKTWDDKNDSYFMSMYKEKKAMKTVLALCFSQSPETYHHWHVFSKGPAGVCIVFDRQSLIEDFMNASAVIAKRVEYLTLPQARQREFPADDLPFLKRRGYRPENEFRVVFTSRTETLPSLPVPIRLASIRGIALSPWMHASLARSTVEAIRNVNGCKKIRISRSTLISNEEWKKFGASAS